MNKNISEISYNSLNLPKQVIIGGVAHKYSYAANGRKLRIEQGTDSRDYAGSFIYENGSLKRVLIDGGYIEGGVYYYNLNDHLGNVRVVASGTGTVHQKNDYYPFGMPMAETSSTEQDKQPYKFGGKEFERKDGLNLYDFGARMMDPVTGRFTMVDPHAESYYGWSPYHYAGNNPVLNIDPFGEDYWSTNDPEEIERFLHTLLTPPTAGGSFYENFNFSSWNHATDADFTGGLTFNDETNTFHSYYTTTDPDGVLNVVGVSIKATSAYDGSASIDGLGSRWRSKASGAINNVYPELALTKGGLGLIQYVFKSIVNPPSDAYNLGFANGGQRKGERNKTAKAEGTDNPFKKYKPSKNDSKKVEYKDADGKTKTKPKPEGFDDYWNKKHPKDKIK